MDRASLEPGTVPSERSGWRNFPLFTPIGQKGTGFGVVSVAWGCLADKLSTRRSVPILQVDIETGGSPWRHRLSGGPLDLHG
jgi:hypothetical protein